MISQEEQARWQRLWREFSVSGPAFNYVYPHGKRVMGLACKLARRIGAYEKDLQLAAFLHDIGKLAISEHILLKPDKLTPAEYVMIQSHCHVGNAMVRKLLDRPRAAAFIRDHHERWDGRGYPRGLHGEQISLQARIIAVADVFDTITLEERPYQTRKLPVDQALRELRRCAWTQFDGHVVDAFCDMMREHKTRGRLDWNHVLQEILAEAEARENITT